MAKIYPANVAPDALPRVRGILLSRISRGVAIAQKWPRKRGPSETPQQVYLTQQFSRAAHMAANAEPMSAETARFFSKDTVWLPRDLLVRAAYGNLFEIILPDGTKAYQTSHAYPGTVTPEDLRVRQYHPNLTSGVLALANSTSSFATKGVLVIPDQDTDIEAVVFPFTPVSGATYVARVLALDAALVITAVETGPAKTISGTLKKPYEFEIGTAMLAGTRYAICLSRTDGADNYALPCVASANANFLWPCRDLGYSRIAKAIPLIGDTVQSGAGAICCSPLLTF
jgi:hypothetical protein